jgi:putative peptidoglycan lipid II flippase
MDVEGNGIDGVSLQKARGSLARDALLVGFCHLISRILGLGREAVFAALYGSGLQTDAFNVAFRIPNLLRDLLGEGALSASFIPVFTEYLAKKGKEEAWKLASMVFNAMALISMAAIAIGVAAAPIIVHLMVPGYKGISGKMDLTISLTRMFFPFIGFISMAAIAMGILNSFSKFVVPSLASVMLSICAIGLGPLLYPLFPQPIMAWTIAMLIGGLGQFLFQIPSIIRLGMRYSPMISFSEPGVKKIIGMMTPAAFGSAANQINSIAMQFMASFLPQGSLSNLNYAWRLTTFPIAIFGESFGITVTPRLSLEAAMGRMEDLRNSLSEALRFLMFLLIPSSVGIMALSSPIVGAIYQHGRFTYENTIATSSVLICFSIGLFSFSGTKVVSRAFYALKDSITPVKVGAASVGISIALAAVLMFPMKAPGLALASSISSIFNLTLLLAIIRRRIGGINGREILGSGIKIFVASAIMGIICWIISEAIGEAQSFLAYMWKLALGIPAGAASYFLLCYLMKVPELKGFIKSLVKRGGIR